MTVPKIAVCISGQMRTWRFCFQNIQQFFSGCDVDYFIHTWDTSGVKKFASLDTFSDTTIAHDPVEISEVIETFKPKKITVESISQYASRKNMTCFSRWTDLFYSFRKSVMLKNQFSRETGVKYDCVVKCRFDIAFNPQIDFLSFMQTSNLDLKEDRRIYVHHTSFIENENFGLNVDDSFFYGNDSIIDYVSHAAYVKSKHINMDMSVKTQKFFGPGAIINSVLMDAHIIPSKINFSSNLGLEIYYLVRNNPKINKPVLTLDDFLIVKECHHEFFTNCN